MKKISIIILIVLIFFLRIVLEPNNLWLMNEKEKDELLNLLYLKENTESFQPICYKKKKIELTSTDRLKIVKFKISKKDYEENNLHYLNERTAELDNTIKVDMGNYYECTMEISKWNVVYEYDKINPKSQTNENITLYIDIFLIIIVLLIIKYTVQKRKN